ncbi:MAG: signal peptide peptidase SppA [Alphaproteobacteria bacterium]|nr:signal peptide peptidase SppA [Alphaproteobacteria bacterium]MBV8547948.1 signal peptide peptidase SppA [Alphaproteobacteria bacterium]
MFAWLGRLFALFGFLFFLIVVAGAIIAYREAAPEPVEPQTVVLNIDFTQPIVEQSTPSPFDIASDDQPIALIDVLRAIAHAKEDPHVKAIIGHFGAEQPGLAATQEIRAALKEFRTSGKPTYAYGTSYGDFGLGNKAYYLASAFEAIWMQPIGSVSLTGIGLQEPFFKTALDKIGVTADFMQREEYKSFMDMAKHDAFVPEVRNDMQNLIADIAAQEADGIAESRGWKAEQVKKLMEEGPYVDDEAMKNGLVTKLAYQNELQTEMEQKFGKEVQGVGIDEYLAYRAPKAAKTEQGGDAHKPVKIAVIYCNGMIMDHAVRQGLMDDKVVGADDLSDAFDDAIKDKDVKGILFRINSPGGSPEASETIRHAVTEAQAKGKPVYVSMGDMAASGGYWVAMNADHIVADAGSITGSIGVIAGKFAADGILEKVGAHMDSVKTADNAGLWSPAEKFTQHQRDRVNALLDRSYQYFIKNVADARHLPLDKMPDLAKGRVWSGLQAQRVGLVDEVGGLSETLEGLRKKAGIGEKDIVALSVFPQPETPVQRLLRMLKSLGLQQAMAMRISSMLGNAQHVLGPWMPFVTHHGATQALLPFNADSLR